MHGSAKATAPAIFEAYNAKLITARTSQRLTQSILDMALTVYNRLLSASELTDILLRVDAGPRHLNPFDSMTNLQLVVQKSKTA